MDLQHVALEVALLRESLVAVAAAKGALPRVGEHVRLEVRLLPKGAAALVAPERPLAQVRGLR